MIEERPVRSGLIAGAIAAVVAALVQLPLHSPSDTLFNSGTVVAGAVALGCISGLTWKLTRRMFGGRTLFFLLWLAGFGAVSLAAIGGETQLSRFVSYMVPLAAIVFGITGVLTPWLALSRVSRSWWPVLAAVGLVIAIGASLAGLGDQQSGRLELPPRESGFQMLPGTPTATLRPPSSPDVPNLCLSLIRASAIKSVYPDCQGATKRSRSFLSPSCVQSPPW